MSEWATLLGFIRAKPSAAGIRCDGDPNKIVRIAGRAFSNAERAVLAIDPSMVEALDANGAIMRVYHLREDAPAAELTTTPRVERAVEQWPAGPTAELGQVLALACDRAVDRVAGLFQAELAAMRNLFTEQNKRLMLQEQNREQEIQLQLEQLAAERDAALERAEQVETTAGHQAQATATELAMQVAGLALERFMSGKLLPSADTTTAETNGKGTDHG